METIITTIIFFLLSIILTIIITRHYSYRSKFNVVLSSIVDLVRISIPAKDKVKILFNDKEVKSLSVVRIILENEGNIDISEEQVKKPPSIKFLNDVKIINVDEINKTDKSNVVLRVTQENQIDFILKYVGKKNRCAFQILVYKDKDYFFITHKDLEFEEGVIKNTSIKFINFEMDRFSSIFSEFMFQIYSRPFLITIVYTSISIILFIAGLINLIFIWFSIDLFQLVGLKPIESRNIGITIITWLIGFILITPIIWINKRVRYRVLFKNTFQNIFKPFQSSNR